MNQLTIIGNLTADPEQRSTQTGKQVTSFTVAVNKRGGDGSDFFRVTAWEKLGELCNKYLSKGRKVCVIGAVGVSAYNDKDGKAHGSLEVTAHEVEFLSPKKDEEKPEDKLPWE